VEINDKGFTVLVNPDRPVVDIVFIHGFTGHPKNTWTQTPERNTWESESRKLLGLFSTKIKASTPRPTVASRKSSQAEVYWPRDLLPQTAPNARILTYGYDTKIRLLAEGPVSHNTIRDHGWEFLRAVEEVRRNEPSRPLLLVAHSLGGLVVKEALRKSRDSKSARRHVKSIVGVLFFGTPHRGANPGGAIHRVLIHLIKSMGVVRYNDRIVHDLMPPGEHLKEMRDEFARLARRRQWIIYCFQEEYGLLTLFKQKVVEDDSSRLDDPSIETTRHISRNHMDMCRFSGTEDSEYRKVAAAIERVLMEKISWFRRMRAVMGG